MNVRDAAIKVLEDAGEPLPAKEIARRMRAENLWQTKGKTPAATVAARLYTDIKAKGDASPFILSGPQTFGLQPGGVRSESKSPRNEARARRSATVREYSFTDAAEKVLEQFGQKRPMHYRDMTERALALGWIATEGKTPEATMYAQVLTEIRRQQKRGKRPRFAQHGRGYIGLTRWMGKGLAFEIEQHNRRVRQDLHKRLLALDWYDFEELITRLLIEMGFEDVEVTRRSGDGGIDVRGTLVVGEAIRTRMAVQVKKWGPKRRVQAPTVQQVRGSLGTHEQGLIVTTSDYSVGARKEAARENAVPVALMNGEQLVALLVECGIGITKQTHAIIELDQGPNQGSASTGDEPARS